MSDLAKVIRFPSERRTAHRLIPLVELRERFGFSERWWRYRLKEGLPRHKWGAGLRFSVDEVEDWLNDRYAS